MSTKTAGVTCWWVDLRDHLNTGNIPATGSRSPWLMINTWDWMTLHSARTSVSRQVIWTVMDMRILLWETRPVGSQFIPSSVLQDTAHSRLPASSSIHLPILTSQRTWEENCCQ